MKLQGISDKGFSRISKSVKKGAGSSTIPRVYVGTYAKYNAGNLKGAWLDLEDYGSKEEFYEAAMELHSDESDPELMFQDWEGIPDEMIGESWIDDKFFEYLEATSNWDDERKEAFETFMGMGILSKDADLSDAISAFEDSYQGAFSDMEDFARDFIDQLGGPEHVNNPEYYFDRESFERDVGYDGWNEDEETGEVLDPNGEPAGYSSMSEMIDSWIDEGVISGEMMSRYFDYEAFARDLMIGGDYSFENGFVFRTL